MKGVCPDCGLAGDILVFVNEAEGKECLAECAKFSEIGNAALRYIALFRHPNRSLSWTRGLKIMQEVRTLVTAGYVQIERKPARPCPPAMWISAIEKMLERKAAGKLRLPIANHNYLREVAYDEADKKDRKSEVLKNQAERAGTVRRHEPEPESAPEMTKEEMAEIRQKLAGIGRSVPNRTHVRQPDAAQRIEILRQQAERLKKEGV